MLKLLLLPTPYIWYTSVQFKFYGERERTYLNNFTTNEEYNVAVVDAIFCKIKEGKNPLSTSITTLKFLIFNMIINLKF